MEGERDFLIRRQYGEGLTGRRSSRSDKVVDTDYLAIAKPPNLPMGVAGSCLIWRWRLNRGGYGIFNVGTHQRLAHRVTFEMTCGHPAMDDSGLHLCHRPYCIHPAHLYAGTRPENVEDREARLGKLDPDILGPMPPGGIPELQRRLQEEGLPLLRYVSRRFQLECDSAAFTWPDPEEMPAQLSLEPTSAPECPGHTFDVPRGTRSCAESAGSPILRRGTNSLPQHNRPFCSALR